MSVVQDVVFTVGVEIRETMPPEPVLEIVLVSIPDETGHFSVAAAATDGKWRETREMAGLLADLARSALQIHPTFTLPARFVLLRRVLPNDLIDLYLRSTGGTMELHPAVLSTGLLVWYSKAEA